MATATTTRTEDAATGAQSVAEAVKRVADAAVAEVQRTAPELAGDFVIVGTAGSKFQIRGAGFSTGGTVTVNGKMAHTTGWGATRIEGTLPDGAKRGDVVVVTIDKDTQQRGYLR